MNHYREFQGSRCLVTGGVGFFGSHLVRTLLAAGATVSIVDTELDHSGTHLAELQPGGYHILTADAGSAEARDFVRAFRPDYLFHLAGMPYAPDTSVFQHDAYRANVESTHSMLSAVGTLPLCRFVLASSACIFGATQTSPLAVGDPVSPPEHYYTVTKRLAEEAVSSHRGDAVICRFGNIYGPGDRHLGRIIPKLCLQLARDAPLTLARSSGASVFEFLYVEDAVDAVLLAALSKDSHRIWHFSGGSSSRTSVAELAQRLSVAYDGRRRMPTATSLTPEKTVRKYLDDSVSRAELHFSPRTSFSTGLRHTLRWYQDHQATIVDKPLPFGQPADAPALSQP